MAVSDDEWLAFGRLMVADLVLQAAPAAMSDGDGDEAASETDDELLERAVVGAEMVESARAALDRSLAEQHPFSIIAANAGLSSLDAAVLAIALSVEVDPRLARFLARVQGRDEPTNVSLRSLVAAIDPQRDEPPVVSALRPDAPLRRSALIELHAAGSSSLFLEQTVVVPHAVVWAVLGEGCLDGALAPTNQYLDLVDDDDTDGEPVVVVVGGGKRLRALEAARRCAGRRFVVAAAPEGDAGWAALVREGTVTGRSLLIEVGDGVPDVGRRWIERASHLGWGLLSELDLPVDDLPNRRWCEYVIDGREPTDDEWHAALGDGVPRTHPLTHDQLDTVARVLPAVGGDVDSAVGRLVSGRLERLATRTRPSRTWDDIVLSPDRTTQLRALADRYRLRDRVYGDWGFADEGSRGLVAVFSGPSGTGKTLATEVLAGELGLDLFKLNLSAVVSKYIGETEKNLEEIFAAASAGDLVLFFDEADSLFGKRSEVKDARDRYANIEVSYLLQRIERYDGVVVLATNLEKNIDDAFLRRIQVRIQFALPTVAERRLIWEQNFPSSAPLVDLDLDWLAERFEFSGASIRNATVHAAFLSAASGTPITMDVAVRGVVQEYRKLGRLVKEADFGDYAAVALAAI